MARPREGGHAVGGPRLVEGVADEGGESVASVVQAHEVHPRVGVPAAELIGQTQ